MNLDRRPVGTVRPLVVPAMIGLIIAFAGCQGPFPQTTFEPTSAFGQAQDDLFLQVFWLAVGVFVVVEGALLYVLIRFRAKPDQPEPKQIHGHTGLEIAWTLAPALIIAIIAVPTIRTIWEEQAVPLADALTIEVIGHQWWWEYRYPDLGISTANELHVPQGRAVTLEMTSADVIHSFWAPRIGGKRDVIAGHTTRISFTADSVGTYLGQCAEYCGASHANMRLRVVADSPDGFDAWVAQQTSAPAPADSLTELEQRGLEIFRTPRQPASNSCLACHTIAGVSFGVLGPNLTHVASRETIAGGVLPNNAENLARWLRNPAEVKPGAGNPGPAGIVGMPDTGLTEAEITALVAYLRTLR